MTKNGEFDTGNSHLIGNHPKILEIKKTISQVADTNATVLISGESGTGKELVAKALHYQSSRREKSKVNINCGAIPESLMESEFFGHVRGSFTGAHQDRTGKFEEAHQGTVFLDEICDLPLSMQVKLLRILETGCFTPVGSNENKYSDVRVIAAANQDLQTLIRKGKFREDLYYRLDVISIDLPPLRDRGNDILLIARHFLKHYSEKAKKNGVQFTQAAEYCLLQHAYKGNIRELRNIVEGAVIGAEGGFVDVSHLKTNVQLPMPETASNGHMPTYKEAKKKCIQLFDRTYLHQCLLLANGSICGAAKIAGLDPSNFNKLLKRSGIGAVDYKTNSYERGSFTPGDGIFLP
ncbi:MAG: sigma-54-dependent Fis family transcriptional regulator [Calditrichaeota bacterium]|nr:sigma-54-dependent Fis family transcriptional regulator [Calditrichota bacterium]